MTHQSFGTVRTLVERDPVTFDFGMFGEHTFTVIPEPSLGDTFDLADAPEPTPETMLEAARVCARFIRRMIIPADRTRFDEALYHVPASHSHVIVDAARWITEQVIARPSPPPSTSSAGRRETGKTSKASTAGTES